MFRRTMALLITIVLLLLPEAREVLADGSTAQDLERVNEQLLGKVAAIELADGSTIKKAKKVAKKAAVKKKAVSRRKTG